MSEILGVIDALEAEIIDGKRLIFRKKTMLDQSILLKLVDKLRRLVNNNNIARTSVELNQAKKEIVYANQQDFKEKKSEGAEKSSVERLIALKKDIVLYKKGIDDYSQNILARLQLTVTKMQKNLISLEKNIEEGRLQVDKNKIEGISEGEKYHEKA